MLQRTDPDLALNSNGELLIQPNTDGGALETTVSTSFHGQNDDIHSATRDSAREPNGHNLSGDLETHRDPQVPTAQAA